MSQQLAVVGSEPSALSLDDTFRVGHVLAASGYFQDAKDVNQAVAKILMGQELGIGPMVSLTSVYVVKGKPSVGASIIAAAIKASAKYDFKIREHTDTVCKIAFFENGEEVGVVDWTADRARKAGTQNMDKWARNMLFARCITDGHRFHCPDVFKSPVYSLEEMGVATDEHGEPQPGAVTVTEIAPAVEEPPYITAIRADGKWSDHPTEDLRNALAWFKDNKPNDPLKKDVVDELRVRAKAVAPPAEETPAPPQPEEEVHEAQLVEEPHPADALEPYAMQHADTPDAEPSPLTQAVSTTRKKASGNFIAFTNKCKEIFKANGICDWDSRDARLVAMNDWLTTREYPPVTTSFDVPSGVLYLMIADLGTEALRW